MGGYIYADKVPKREKSGSLDELERYEVSVVRSQLESEVPARRTSARTACARAQKEQKTRLEVKLKTAERLERDEASL